MVKAILAFSADPITLGHVDVIRRAKKVFNNLTVAIGVNPDKKYMFPLKEREAFTRVALNNMDVDVTSFEGLLVDFACINDVDIIIRSARDATDFNYEKMLHDINMSQNLGIDTVMFFPTQSLSHISSSASKEIQKHHGSIHEYVPLVVKEALERKMSDQFLLGVTGEIGAGKSYISSKIIELATKAKIVAHNIDMDLIGHDILEKLTDPLSVATRLELIGTFGKDIKNSKAKIENGINIKVLGGVIFSDRDARDQYGSIVEKAMMIQYRQRLVGRKGLILVNSALFAEMGIGYLTNNNIILIKATDKVKVRRLETRKYDKKEIEKRTNSQMNFASKLTTLNRQVERYGYGKILTFDNSNATDENIMEFFTTEVLPAYKGEKDDRRAAV